MKHAVQWIQATATSLGGPGLFIIAFLDSSFLSFPEVIDLLIIWMVIQHPHRMVYYAAMATLGSLVGCFALYYVGRKGGEALVRRRFQGPRVERALSLVQRYGLLSILVPALLPPPAPFKIFVLMAGVASVSPMTFALALILGRGLRYFGEGVLALWYGQVAIDYVRENGQAVAVGLAVAVVAAGVAYAVWRRTRPRRVSGL